MSRPSKKDLKAALDKLRAPKQGTTAPGAELGGTSKLEPKKDSRRIRKQGV